MSEYELSAFTSTKGLSSDSKFDPMILFYILLVAVVVGALFKFTSNKKNKPSPSKSITSIQVKSSTTSQR